MPNNPLTPAELQAYINPLGVPQMPAGYFLASPVSVPGPFAYRLFDASYISLGIIDPNRLGTGATGAGNLYLADDGTWKAVGGGGATTLDGLTDVTISAPANAQVLAYNSTTLQWENQTPTAGGGGNMNKSTYDVDNDGVVDSAETTQIIVRNSTGSTLTKGSVVYLSGATGNRPNAVLSQANAEATSSKTIGIVVSNISNNSDGYVAVSGTLHNLDTSAFADGVAVWLSPSVAGGMTTTVPSEPNHSVFIGYIARSHPNQGRLVIAIQNGYELNELHDVVAPSPTNNDLLRFNSSLGYWQNQTISTIFGGTPLVSVPTLAQVTTAGNTTTNAILASQFQINGSTRNARLSSDNVGGFDINYNIGGTPDWRWFGGGTTALTTFKASGNVLIGTTTDAGYKLDVNGTARVQTSAYFATVSGNVGIGITNPQVKFSVQGAQNNTIAPVNGVAKFVGGDAGVFIGNLAGTPNYGAWIQAMRESDGLTFPLHLQPNGGNVGIGTTSPTRKLTVIDTTTGAGLAIDSSTQSNNYYIEASKAGSSRFSVYENSDVVYINSYGRMVLRANQLGGSTGFFGFLGGNVLINTTTDAGYKLDINGTVRSTGLITATGGISTGILDYRISTIPVNTTFINDTSRLVQTPAAWIWHDILAFNRLTGSYETYDGTAWTAATINGELFAQKQDQSILIINNTTILGARWTFTSGNTPFSQGQWLILGLNWTASQATVSILVESWNGTVWTTRHTSTTTYNATNYFAYVSDYAGDSQLRITITRTGGGNQFALSSIKLLSARPGDQGTGKEAEFPYYWNGNRNIGIGGNAQNTSKLYVVGPIYATANNDALVGVDVNPTFSSGSFTGIIQMAARFANRVHISNSNVLSIGANTVSNDTSYGNGYITSFNQSFTINGSGGTPYFRLHHTTGNLVLQNGGTFTDAGYRLDVNGTVRVQNNLTVSSLTTDGPVVSNSGVLTSVAGYTGMVTIQQTPPLPPVTFDIQNGIIVSVL